MMKTSATRIPAFLVLAGLSLAWFACGETIDIANNPPTVVFGDLLAEGGVLNIYYELSDAEGDDVAIEIAVCQQAQCLSPTPAPGGDGTQNLPTIAGEPVLHLFRWAAACDVESAALETERRIRITPSDEDRGLMVESDPVNLDGLGVVAGSEACEDATRSPAAR